LSLGGRQNPGYDASALNDSETDGMTMKRKQWKKETVIFHSAVGRCLDEVSE
jgi:hypothetical protein